MDTVAHTRSHILHPYSLFRVTVMEEFAVNSVVRVHHVYRAICEVLA